MPATEFGQAPDGWLIRAVVVLMEQTTRRVPVYRQVQQQPSQPSSGPSPQVVVHLDDGLQPYTPVRSDVVASAAPTPATPVPQAPARPAQPPQEPPSEGEFDVLGKVMFALRGRWWLAILLALVGGAAGAYAGFHFKPVTYRSEGVISISYAKPKVLREADAGGSLTLFDSHLYAQTDVIRSRDVIEKALLTDIWQKTGK